VCGAAAGGTRSSVRLKDCVLAENVAALLDGSLVASGGGAGGGMNVNGRVDAVMQGTEVVDNEAVLVCALLRPAPSIPSSPPPHHHPGGRYHPGPGTTPEPRPPRSPSPAP
jgi:hypothetical protein